MRFILRITLCCIIFFGVTHKLHADVVINEIAWMGTVSSANDEWIELYNNGTSPVSVEGWTLSATDGSPTINLKGSINAGSYYLCERTDDTTIPTVIAGVIYSGALSNTGENLILKNNTEEVINTVSMTFGWTAGNSTSKETMQRKSDGSWITAVATPGSTNASTGTTTESNPETPTQSAEPDDTTDDIKQLIDPDPIYSSRMIIPDIIVEQVPYKFESDVKKNEKFTDIEGRYEWSLGDGSSYIFKKSTPFMYTYQDPGQYVVVLRYYSNAFKEKPDAIHKKTITVIPASADIRVNKLTGTITLTNTSTDDIDLGNWKIQSAGESFLIPLYTLLEKGASLSIPARVHQLSIYSGTLELLTPTGFRATTAKSSSHSYTPKTSTVSASSSDSDISSLAEENLFHSHDTIIKTKQNGNSLPMLPWITLFGLLLILGTIGIHYVPKQPETSLEDPETDPI